MVRRAQRQQSGRRGAGERTSSQFILACYIAAQSASNDLPRLGLERADCIVGTLDRIDQKAQERATVLMLVHLTRIMKAARRGWRPTRDH
jgi:hypothetical protein